nr:hypothetical protein [uncultured Campylobacter sp.]
MSRFFGKFIERCIICFCSNLTAFYGQIWLASGGILFCLAGFMGIFTA